MVSDGGTPAGADVLPTTTMATKNARHIGSTVPAPTMPGFVRGALAARGLTDAYEARPKYQQTEYLTSVHAAKLNDEKRKRMNVMLDELAAGNVFQGKPWTPPEPTTK